MTDLILVKILAQLRAIENSLVTFVGASVSPEASAEMFNIRKQIFQEMQSSELHEVLRDMAKKGTEDDKGGTSVQPQSSLDVLKAINLRKKV